jgi:hypothetical protein
MTLNQLRQHAVEELQAARSEKDELQSQVEVLKVCLLQMSSPFLIFFASVLLH